MFYHSLHSFRNNNFLLHRKSTSKETELIEGLLRKVTMQFTNPFSRLCCSFPRHLGLETPDYTTSGRAHRQRADKECIINDLNCLWTANAHKNILIIAICKIVPYESRSNKSQPKQAQPREAHSMWILWQKQVETAVRVRPKGKRTD